MNNKTSFSSILLFITLSACAQISDGQYQKIDSLFIDWNKPNHPGGVVGIMQNGKTVFSKAYGLASMEYLVPNSIGTIFNTGSVSKQFTAMGIVLLHQQGKLSVDDDIRKHLPELPDFGEPITIRHMLHHTSGLRSLHAMLELGGWGDEDYRTNEDLNRFMENQRDLNFKPGEEFLYCNTGYMLMVNIIEKVTGEKFPNWMKDSIFEPLGMRNTYVEENSHRIVPNNASSYYNAPNNGFVRPIKYWGYVGSGNMHSTSDDLLKWLSNFSDPQPDWDTPFKMMQTLDNFNNGKPNNYAFGVFMDEINGHKRVQHSGAIGGFRASISTFPFERLSIVVLANFSDASPRQKAIQVSEILLKNVDNPKVGNWETSNALKTVRLSNDQLRKYQSSYWSEKHNNARKIYLKNDTLMYFRGENNENALAPIGKDEFQMLGGSVEKKVKFELDGKNKTMFVTINDNPPDLYQDYQPMVLTKDELASYTGKFYSPELETTYTISLAGDTLSCYHPRRGDFVMKVLKKDVLEGQWPFEIGKYSRDENGAITGIRVSNGRVRNLWFEKQQ